MTIAIAWVARQADGLRHLYFASDSRTRGGYVFGPIARQPGDDRRHRHRGHPVHDAGGLRRLQHCWRWSISRLGRRARAPRPVRPRAVDDRPGADRPGRGVAWSVFRCVPPLTRLPAPAAPHGAQRPECRRIVSSVFKPSLPHGNGLRAASWRP